jgi:hypothetical protein
MRPWLAFGGYLLRASTLEPRLRELVVLRVGWQCRSPYEWGQHVIIGRKSGVLDSELQRVTFGPDAEGWSASTSLWRPRSMPCESNGTMAWRRTKCRFRRRSSGRQPPGSGMRTTRLVHDRLRVRPFQFHHFSSSAFGRGVRAAYTAQRNV